MASRGNSDTSYPTTRATAPPPARRGSGGGRCPCCGSATLPRHGRLAAALDDGTASAEGAPRDLERMLIRLGGNGF